MTFEEFSLENKLSAVDLNLTNKQEFSGGGLINRTYEEQNTAIGLRSKKNLSNHQNMSNKRYQNQVRQNEKKRTSTMVSQDTIGLQSYVKKNFFLF